MTTTPQTPDALEQDESIIQPDHDTGHASRPKTQASTPTQAETIPPSRIMLNYALIAAVFLGVGFFLGLNLSSDSLDEATVRDIVEQAVAGIDVGGSGSGIDMDVMVDDDPYLGPEDAPIVIVEFSAYACPYCSRHFNTTLEPLLENYGDYIRYVFRDFPTINPNISQPAALAAGCAHEQGKFWEYHELLFANQSQLGMAFYNQAAADVGLDMEQFTACFDENRYADEIENDFFDGMINGITGTPSFYINGEFFSGAQPYEFFERIIQRELRARGINATDA